MKACKEFHPFVTNKDVCAHWVHSADEPDPMKQFFPFCDKGLACPTLGQRPERLDQESDTEDL